MPFFKKNYRIPPIFDNEPWIIKKAEEALETPPPHITDALALASEGGIHDYYSNGDYWWPNPDTPDGLPYIRRDGVSNPGNFDAHRRILRQMGTLTVHLSLAWKLTGEEKYACRAVRFLQEFFLDRETFMNPSLTYAQAIPGVCSGRGIGIIDTIHLADIPFAISCLSSSASMTREVLSGLKSWFSQYLLWLFHSQNGREEMNTANNHSVCFFMQAGAFALLTGNEEILNLCRGAFKTRLLGQMDPDGSFPLELARTKPYSYSIFVLDNMVSLCHLLSTPKEDLWEYETERGQGIQKAVRFLTPYLLDKSSWPYARDVTHYDSFPARASFMMLAGCHYGIQELVDLFHSLPFESQDEEVRRNVAAREPMLWM